MAHYFTNDNIEHNRKIIKVKIKNQDFQFITDNGVFSKNGMDFGTRTLLENLNYEEIKGLIGTWYYDETKNGKSIKFQVDGICYCKYYQNYGSGTFSNLNGWVTRKGVWHYSKENKLLSITMDSEISYYYDISDLSSTTVTLKLSSDSPAGTSIVYSANPLYK